MKKYYLNDHQISEQEALDIKARNMEFLESRDFSLWAKCQFISVVDIDEEPAGVPRTQTPQKH